MLLIGVDFLTIKTSGDIWKVIENIHSTGKTLWGHWSMEFLPFPFHFFLGSLCTHWTGKLWWAPRYSSVFILFNVFYKHNYFHEIYLKTKRTVLYATGFFLFRLAAYFCCLFCCSYICRSLVSIIKVSDQECDFLLFLFLSSPSFSKRFSNS